MALRALSSHFIDHHLLFSGNYRKLCVVEADTSFLRHRKPRKNKDGTSGEYWDFDFTFVLWFSATELHAQLVWKENVCIFNQLKATFTDLLYHLYYECQGVEKRYVCSLRAYRMQS